MERSQDGATAPLPVSSSKMSGNMNPYTKALVAGAVAGTTVDLSLYPIDTLKTRLQSAAGFRASGGFRGIYSGVGSAALGAAPGAAFFFIAYEISKVQLASLREAKYGDGRPEHGWLLPLEHMAAASVGEIAACAIRVPTEVVKQRAQAAGGRIGVGATAAGATAAATATGKGSSLSALQDILALRPKLGTPGVIRELYRGWGITVMREVPFTVIQFPLWEAMKSWRSQNTNNKTVNPLESALFGSIAGAVAAGLTTPLDVLKTRIMLSKEKTTLKEIFRHVMRTTGPRGFLAGIGPRIAWISAGGAVFLGSYQWAYNALGA